jgi:hypothetical protein
MQSVGESRVPHGLTTTAHGVGAAGLAAIQIPVTAEVSFWTRSVGVR